MRMTPHQRRTVIMVAATRLAREGGLPAVTHGDVAKRCSVPTSAKTVRHYFGDRSSLWRAVIVVNPELAHLAAEVGLC